MSPRPTPEPDTLTRNLNELLQEYRVLQTGSQILTGFLLTVPFSARFDQLSVDQRSAFLAVLVGSVITTGLLVTPVALHRILFRRGRRLLLVETANLCARAGLATMAATTAGVLFLVFDLVLGRTAAWVALGLTLAGTLLAWWVLPLVLDRLASQPETEDAPKDAG